MSTSGVRDRIERALDVGSGERYGPGRVGLQVASIAGFLLLWWALVEFGVSAFGFEFGLFVGPVVTGRTLLTYLAGEPMTSGGQTLYVHALYSTWRVAAGVGVATLLGIPLGLLVGTSQEWEDFLYPALEALRPIPPVAWVPISVLLFPTLSLTALSINLGVLFVVFVGAFFPVFVNTVEGVRSVEAEYPRAARSLGADRAAIFRHVVLPATLPSILTGVSLGIGLGWITVVAAEIIAGNYGVGYVIFQAYRLLQTTTIAVGMVTIGALGYVSAWSVRFIARRLTPWSAVETNPHST